MTKIHINKHFNTQEEYDNWLDNELDNYTQGKLVHSIEIERSATGITILSVTVIS